MNKNAIAVYNPTDQIERAVQESFHSVNGEWLGAFPCQLLARALSTLKSPADTWIGNADPELIKHRIAYFFAPFMCRDKTIMVFPTYPFFLRDILENCGINAYLHDPVTFITPPLAHYFCREYPIHIHFNTSSLKGYTESSWTDLGGFLVSDEDVTFKPEAIEKIQCKDEQYTAIVDEILGDIGKTRESPLSKVAISQVSPGVFTSDRHERNIEPDSVVWDKKLRTTGSVSQVDAGETGLVYIVYDDGNTVTIPKVDFDHRYVIGE